MIFTVISQSLRASCNLTGRSLNSLFFTPTLQPSASMKVPVRLSSLLNSRLNASMRFCPSRDTQSFEIILIFSYFCSETASPSVWERRRPEETFATTIGYGARPLLAERINSLHVLSAQHAFRWKPRSI